MPIDGGLVTVPLAAAAIQHAHRQFHQHHPKIAKQVHRLATEAGREAVKHAIKVASEKIEEKS